MNTTRMVAQPEVIGARDSNDPTEHGQLTALLYLRVSTKEQAEMGGEAEGFSIPAQREACRRKADQLGAVVLDEFIDRGESARSANRPELQRLLGYVAERSVSYVIVHKVDRLARNRADDVEINLALQAAGVQLVSVTENIDETPSGILLHGIMSSIAEFYSRNLANEVIKGSTQKAKSGGTVSKAPTGYRNIRKIIDGLEVRTVEIDPERGPLMVWAFEQYATGEWTMRTLLDALTEKGLTSTGGPRTPSRPLSLSNFARLLRTPYYKGDVTYRGVTYKGTHELLVSPELFDEVQAVLDAHGRAGEKRRIHHHFLKGSIFCGQCDSRLSVMKVKNRWETIYPYFYCLGRQEHRTDCTQRMLSIDEVEAKIEEHYATVQLTAEQKVQVRSFILKRIDETTQTVRKELARQALRVTQLEDERDKLLQAYYAGAVPLPQLKTEQERIGQGVLDAERLVKASEADLSESRVKLDQALDLIEDCQTAYLQATDPVRRLMNQAFFIRLLVDDDGVRGELAQPFATLVGLAAVEGTCRQGLNGAGALIETGDIGGTEKTPAPKGAWGLGIDWLVGEGGLEPPHPFGHRNLNPARLPIPPLARVGSMSVVARQRSFATPEYHHRLPVTSEMRPQVGLGRWQTSRRGCLAPWRPGSGPRGR